MGIEKIDLLEYGWHKTGDPTQPKGFLWENPERPDFYIVYDELDKWACVLYKYAKGSSRECETLEELYTFMNLNKDYEHEWE